MPKPVYKVLMLYPGSSGNINTTYKAACFSTSFGQGLFIHLICGIMQHIFGIQLNWGHS